MCIRDRPDAEWLNELPSHSDLELSEDDSDSVSPVPAPGQAQSSSDAAAAGGAPRSGRMLWQVARSRTVEAAQPSEQWQRLLDAEVAAERTRWQAKIAPTGELYRTRSSPSAAALAPAPVPPMLLSQRSSPSLPRPAVPPPVAEMDEAPAKPLHGSTMAATTDKVLRRWKNRAAMMSLAAWSEHAWNEAGRTTIGSFTEGF